ncbi:hypothetical protein HYZ70_02185 [Candidatus Curtissbacteria bacterium]|nr:hypothetical protein [Candidatus Curtissbacteria bacterium]
MLEANTLKMVVKSIVEHQFAVVGPLALEQANKVPGLKASDGGNISVEIQNGDTKTMLTQLVKRYEELFGLASVEVCRDAVKEVKPSIPQDELPEILR